MNCSLPWWIVVCRDGLCFAVMNCVLPWQLWATVWSWVNKKMLTETKTTTRKPKDKIAVILLHRMSNGALIQMSSHEKNVATTTKRRIFARFVKRITQIHHGWIEVAAILKFPTVPRKCVAVIAGSSWSQAFAILSLVNRNSLGSRLVFFGRIHWTLDIIIVFL